MLDRSAQVFSFLAQFGGEKIAPDIAIFSTRVLALLAFIEEARGIAAGRVKPHRELGDFFPLEHPCLPY